MTSSSVYPNGNSNASFEAADSGAKPRLVTDANKGADAGDGAHRAKRDGRYKALKLLWEITSLERVKNCRRHSVRLRGTVDVRYSPDHAMAGYSGVATCGSIWACPVCSARIQSGRRTELSRLVEWASEQGFSVLFGTMTLRHHVHQSLKFIWKALGECFRAVRTNGSVRKMRDELGFSGYVRTVEVTHGRKNGWHPHIHMLYIIEKDAESLSDQEIKALGDAEFSAWKAAALREDLGSPLRERYQLERVTGDIQEYMAKAEYDPKSPGGIAKEGYRHEKSAAFEMAGAATKVAWGKSRTPFQILADFQETYNADDADLWLEYEQASKGKKALTWSNGLKKRIALDEVTDEELAEEQVGGQEDTIFSIRNWSRDISPNPVLASQLLTAVELGGCKAGLAFCEEKKIEILMPDHPDVVADQRLVRQRAVEARENSAKMSPTWGSADRHHRAAELSEKLQAASESPQVARMLGLDSAADVAMAKHELDLATRAAAGDIERDIERGCAERGLAMPAPLLVPPRAKP